MTTYIKLSNLEFPLHEGDIRLEYPEISESQTGENFPYPDSYARLVYGDKPTYDEATQYLKLLHPYQSGSVWKVDWEVWQLSVKQIEYNKREEEQWLQKRAISFPQS